MANMEYEINGKADTKPIENTVKAIQNMAKKVSDINNKISVFTGAAVFQKMGEAINKALEKYDEFNRSVNEMNISKQTESIKTSLAGTIGTIRDELVNGLDNVFGGNFLKSLDETIPKIGAAIIGAMSVAEQIVINIKNAFFALIKPETWNEFFSHAADLAGNFGDFFSHLLRDVFDYAINFFKWGFENMNLLNLLWAPFNWIFSKVIEFLEFLGTSIPKNIKDFFEKNNEAAKDAFNKMPSFSLSDDTKQASDDLASKLKTPFTSIADTLTDFSTLYQASFNEALEKINGIINRMKDPKAEPSKPVDLSKLIKEIQNTLKTSLSSAGQGFSDATGNINNILGNASGGAVDKIRDKMSGLNEQFKESTKTIDAMFDALKEAKSVEEIEQLFDAITGKIGNIKNLADAMNKMEGEAKKAKLSFDLLQGVMQSIGELGTVIEAIMSSNWIGLIIMLIGKLADLFGSLSSKAAAAKNILTFLVDTIADVIGTLGPYLDMIFEPLLETFAALGRVIGSLLNLIIPIVGMITKLVSSFDILTPILNTVAIFLAILADALGSIWNTIAEIIEKATLGIVDLDRMQTNNYKRMMESIEVQQDYNKYQNNSTSYSVAGDMYININFSQSYVNGDARQIAMMIRDEIRLAEKAGY